ncbi:polysaccharide export protein [Methylocystis sp. B8]|nr:polysaccharide export protein [Methylocystis sp. B8]
MSALLSGCASPTTDCRPEIELETAQRSYTAAAGDRLRVAVLGQRELSKNYLVDRAGRIAFPLIGFVKVQGLSAAAVERVIAARLRDGYIRDPKVTVQIVAFQPFFVLGEVARAGQYSSVENMTVRSAIAAAGGFKPGAYEGGAHLTRLIDRRPVTACVTLDVPVRPGDTITVLQDAF